MVPRRPLSKIGGVMYTVSKSLMLTYSTSQTRLFEQLCAFVEDLTSGQAQTEVSKSKALSISLSRSGEVDSDVLTISLVPVDSLITDLQVFTHSQGSFWATFAGRKNKSTQIIFETQLQEMNYEVETQLKYTINSWLAVV